MAAATKTTDLAKRLAEAEAESTRLRLKLAKVKVCMGYFGTTGDSVFLDILQVHLK